MNYIESYYGAIESGKVVTSEKIRRTYKHLVAKMHDPTARMYMTTTKPTLPLISSRPFVSIVKASGAESP